MRANAHHPSLNLESAWGSLHTAVSVACVQQSKKMILLHEKQTALSYHIARTQTVKLSPLDRADGSASYTSNGYSITVAVNGPIEVQRRDELPEEAAIDVVIRPATGVGGIVMAEPISPAGN